MDQFRNEVHCQRKSPACEEAHDKCCTYMIELYSQHPQNQMTRKLDIEQNEKREYDELRNVCMVNKYAYPSQHNNRYYRKYFY